MRPYLGPPWTNSRQIWCVRVFHHVLLKYGHENAKMQKRKFDDVTLRYSIGSDSDFKQAFIHPKYDLLNIEWHTQVKAYRKWHDMTISLGYTRIISNKDYLWLQGGDQQRCAVKDATVWWSRCLLISVVFTKKKKKKKNPKSWKFCWKTKQNDFSMGWNFSIYRVERGVDILFDLLGFFN